MNRRDDFGFPLFGAIGAAIFGVLLDLAPLPEEPVDEYAKRGWRRKVVASGFRWVSDVWVSLVIGGMVLGSKGMLAPLIVLPWLFIMNRLVVSTGNVPSPAAAVAHTRLGFLMLASAVLATLVSAVNLLIPLSVLPVVATIAALVAGVVALADAWLTAQAIRKAQVPPAPDMTAYAVIQAIFGISDLALAKYMESGSLEAAIDPATRMLTARIPVGPDTLLEDRKALDARVALKAPDRQVAFADPSTDELILEPVDAATAAQRDAVTRSGGLFAEALDTGLNDLEVIDLGLVEQPLPRLR